MMRLVAHRGASAEAPENTLEAFRLAWAQGADAIECDVRRTGDGQWVCLHDADLRRTTGVRGRVADWRWADVRGLDAGRWKGPRWTGARIPRLEAVLDALPRGKGIQIEIKDGPQAVPSLIPLLRAVARHAARVQPIAFDAAVVAAIRRLAPELAPLWLTDYRRGPLGLGWRPAPATILRTLAACGAAGLGSRAHPALTPALLRTLRDGGYQVTVWTVDRLPAARRYQRLGLDALATNHPGRLREGLARMGD